MKHGLQFEMEKIQRALEGGENEHHIQLTVYLLKNKVSIRLWVKY